MSDIPVLVYLKLQYCSNFLQFPRYELKAVEEVFNAIINTVTVY